VISIALATDGIDRIALFRGPPDLFPDGSATYPKRGGEGFSGMDLAIGKKAE